MSIIVKDLIKNFGDFTAVNNVSFEVPENALFCVVGPSGCGKSTLLRLIAGLDVPDSGSISLDGVEVAGPDKMIPPEARRTGVVFQSYALWPHMTVAENIVFPYQAQGIKARAAQELAESTLRPFL